VSGPSSSRGLESPLPSASRPRRKPQADLYTILLVIALLAVLAGILFLYLFMKSYDFKLPGNMPVGMASEKVFSLFGFLIPNL